MTSAKSWDASCSIKLQTPELTNVEIKKIREGKED